MLCADFELAKPNFGKLLFSRIVVFMNSIILK